MYIFLGLFLLSLSGIIFMITRKLFMMKEKLAVSPTEDSFISQVLDSEKIKKSFLRGLKIFLHTAIWVILKIYIKSSAFLKKKIAEFGLVLKHKVKEIIGFHKNEQASGEEKTKYFEIISEYKQKISRIKHRIREEEGLE